MKLPASPRVVITGAGSGLGRALAEKLGRRGGRIVVSDIHLVRAEETAELVRRAGGTATVVRCDVGHLPDVEALRLAAEELFGEVDLLVNNAGVAAGGKVGEISIADWEWLLRINLWGVIYGCHVFVPRMRARGAGAILNVASCAGLACLPERLVVRGASFDLVEAILILVSRGATRRAAAAPSTIITAICSMAPMLQRTGSRSSHRSSQVSAQQGPTERVPLRHRHVTARASWPGAFVVRPADFAHLVPGAGAACASPTLRWGGPRRRSAQAITEQASDD